MPSPFYATPNQSDPSQPSPTRRKLAEALLNASGAEQPSGDPIQHPLQAMGQASKQWASAYLQKQLGIPTPYSSPWLKPKQPQKPPESY